MMEEYRCKMQNDKMLKDITASMYPHSPAPSPAATGLVDIWIIAGQSNAVGEIHFPNLILSKPEPLNFLGDTGATYGTKQI